MAHAVVHADAPHRAGRPRRDASRPERRRHTGDRRRSGGGSRSASRRIGYWASRPTTSRRLKVMKSICAPDGFVGFPGGVESQDPERDRRRPWTIHHRAEQPSAGVRSRRFVRKPCCAPSTFSTGPTDPTTLPSRSGRCHVPDLGQGAGGIRGYQPLLPESRRLPGRPVPH
jgi:hypothetical protein